MGLITISLEPTFEVRDRCGLSTSTRKVIQKIWPVKLPKMDPEMLARLVFCFENNPERHDGIISGAYFLMALPAGWIIRKWGYRRGVITGLVFFGIGALMFIPGSRINSFYFFVLSLFVIGCGLTCLETSANPYTTVLGHPDKAESRINLSWTAGWRTASVLGCQHRHSLCPGGYLRACCGTGPVKDQVARPKESA